MEPIQITDEVILKIRDVIRIEQGTGNTPSQAAIRRVLEAYNRVVVQP